MDSRSFNENKKIYILVFIVPVFVIEVVEGLLAVVVAPFVNFVDDEPVPALDVLVVFDVVHVGGVVVLL